MQHVGTGVCVLPPLIQWFHSRPWMQTCKIQAFNYIAHMFKVIRRLNFTIYIEPPPGRVKKNTSYWHCDKRQRLVNSFSGKVDCLKWFPMKTIHFCPSLSPSVSLRHTGWSYIHTFLNFSFFFNCPPCPECSKHLHHAKLVFIFWCFTFSSSYFILINFHFTLEMRT